MDLQKRINLLTQLGKYLQSDNSEWGAAKEKASQKNAWFTPEFIQLAADNIANRFLDEQKLSAWAAHYHLDDNIQEKNIGIVMAGNIPMVGFHDFMTVFLSGHRQTIKLSSNDDILLKNIIDHLSVLDTEVITKVNIQEQLKGCDAYIATGSNNSGRYFEQYFGKYPHIIRKNKTSVAILTGNETVDELEKLTDDIHQFFGLGCRNITKIFVPKEYDFVPLLKQFDKYKYFADHHKYKNNFDYQLSILLLNNLFYMTNGSTLLTENTGNFSPISQVHYEYYEKENELISKLHSDKDIQCIVGRGHISFGQAQCPSLMDYADGVDTMAFLLGL